MDVLFLCKKIYIEPDFIDGGILVSAEDGKILEIFKNQTEINSWMYTNEASETIDFGDLVLMPGLIDSHVHINDPGREEWEGFLTATKSAAAGGFTTIVDMPLNSIPPTTTVENFKTKLKASEGKLFVDVAFWGGLVPGNQHDLKKLVDEGVCGFKCFLCPTGVPEFEHVDIKDLTAALEELKDVDTVILFHAEKEPKIPTTPESPDCNPKKYETFLQTKPPSMEEEAIKIITDLSKIYKNRFHIVHLSSAASLPLLKEARNTGSRITIETCHHYLSICSEEIPDERTEFKCCPPIRSKANKEKLWKAVIEKEIDLVVSDHSPCTPGLKCLTYGKNRGDFLKAWGGISSVQFGLSLFWTNGKKYGVDFKDIMRCLCTEPAKLCGLSNQKGKIEIGYDADFVVWNPDETFCVTPDIIQFQNKANPYMNKVLRGVVHATIVRGYHVYQQYDSFTEPFGKIIRPANQNTKSLVQL